MATQPTEQQEVVLQYLKNHQVTENLNQIVNKLCRARDEDPWGYLIKEFQKLQPSQITKVWARQIFDSRGSPTVEVEVTTLQGVFRAAVPSGASVGVYEALELRDGGAAYMGKGVSKAVANVNNVIGPRLIGMDPTDQKKIDTFMVEDLDGSKNEWGWSKSKLGANAILGVSLAVCRAGAAAKGVPLYQHIAELSGNTDLVLPTPAFNIINGGTHAGNKLAIQEFMILPIEAKSFSEALQIGAEVYHNLKEAIKEKYGADATSVGDEGGFAPNILNSKDALDLITQAIDAAGYTGRVKIAMDVAASEFYTDFKVTVSSSTTPPPSLDSTTHNHRMPPPSLTASPPSLQPREQKRQGDIIPTKLASTCTSTLLF